MNEIFKERLRFCIKKQFDSGKRALVYGKKRLSPQQADEIESLVKKMKSAAVEEFEGFNKLLLDEIESNLDFLGAVFIQD